MVKALQRQLPNLTGEAYIEQPFNHIGYRGIHLSYRTTNGLSAEIQVSTKEAWAINKQTDAIYEKWRNIAEDNLTKEQEKQKREDYQKSKIL